MKTQLSRYLNGNYYVEVYDDGTKVKVLADNKAKEFIPAFPDSVILKLTHFSQTSEQLVAIDGTESISVVPGRTLANINYNPILMDLKPYTEVTIVDKPLSHPAMLKFIQNLHGKQISVNLVVEQADLIEDMAHTGIVTQLVSGGHIKNLIVILSDSTDDGLFSVFKELANVIVQIPINKVTEDDLERLAINYVSLKLVGVANETDLASVDKDNILQKLKKVNHKFTVISFDKLAISQLGISDRQIDKCSYFVCKTNSRHSMYIDLVTNIYAKTPYSANKFLIKTPNETLTDMFHRCQCYDS